MMGKHHMAKKHLPPADVLRQLLRYELETGKLFWKCRPREMFSSDRIYKSWNSRLAGKEALTSIDNYGYRFGTVAGRSIRAHLVVWKLVHGDVPSGVVDHINRDKLDNRISNLRDIPKRENHLNCRKSKNNTSGVTGVFMCKRRWQASIVVNYKTIYLGRFDTVEEAARVRRLAEREYGFHENHGL
jgi:hypothetical protein